MWGWAGLAGSKRLARRSRMLTEHITSGMCVLELGCGTGLYTKAIVEREAYVAAIDVSLDLIKVARRTVSNSRVVFIVQDAHHLGFSDAVFNSIIGSSVLHHCEAMKVLRECFRVLKPGGTIHLTEPNMANPQIFYERHIPFFRELLHETSHESAFFSSQIKRFLLESGFKNPEIHHFDFLPPWIPVVFYPLALRLGSRMERLPVISRFSGSLSITAEK